MCRCCHLQLCACKLLCRPKALPEAEYVIKTHLSPELADQYAKRVHTSTHVFVFCKSAIVDEGQTSATQYHRHEMWDKVTGFNKEYRVCASRKQRQQATSLRTDEQVQPEYVCAMLLLLETKVQLNEQESQVAHLSASTAFYQSSATGW